MQPQSRGGRNVPVADWTSWANRQGNSLTSTVRCTRGVLGKPRVTRVGVYPPVIETGGPCWTLGESSGRDKPRLMCGGFVTASVPRA